MLKADESPEATDRRANLTKLVNLMQEFESLAEFLEHTSLVMDGDTTSDRSEVSLITMHAAKGLEFDVVFLPGWEEGIFPHKRSFDEGSNATIEEERRLAYVAITRAKKRLHVCSAKSRMVYGRLENSKVSVFLRQLPPEAVERE